MKIREAARDSGSFTLEADDGTGTVGLIQVRTRPVPMVTWIEVAPAARRRGVATRLYEAAARLSCTRWNEPLHSDTRRRDDGAQEFWDKQAMKGRATYLPARGQYVLTCPAPASLGKGRR